MVCKAVNFGIAILNSIAINAMISTMATPRIHVMEESL